MTENHQEVLQPLIESGQQYAPVDPESLALMGTITAFEALSVPLIIPQGGPATGHASPIIRPTGYPDGVRDDKSMRNDR